MTNKIFFFATGLGKGGAETQLVRLALGLAERGWKPTIASLMDRNLFSDELRGAGIAYHSLGLERGRPEPAAAWKLWRLLRQYEPDVFCSFLAAANALGAPVARAAGVPAVVASVRTPVSGSARREWMLRVAAPAAHTLVFNSQVVADDATLRGVAPRHRSEVIRNGLDFEEFAAPKSARAATRKALGVGARDFVWLCVGNLRPEKNYLGLLKAFRAVHADYPRARLVSAGGFFEHHQPALELAGDLIDAGVVQLLGRRDDIPNLLAASDASVLASHYEASPNALIEAMACGVPVVGTKVGGVPEILTGPDVGILAETSSPENLERAMRAMMALPARDRRALGERGRAHAAQRFGRVRMVDEWERLFLRRLAATGRVSTEQLGTP